ncbi:LuxR C-terminal-related transcriptional regulator [Namhaeicola litoreus]|uniref:LuxR C-terminal-related transcriptional regulator n=1 Tax=Namhaeicola litoreus TaxID=1052145 RepID=A0ABW3Y109_9FLAO
MLYTKLNRPKISQELLPRPHLIQKFTEKSFLPFILVSAPAGFGKSVLVSQWLENHPKQYAWLSLEESMNDSQTFISYFVEMLKKFEALDLQKLKKIEQDYTFLSWQAIIDTVINTLNQLELQTSLILDDYHLITNPEIHALMEALISENMNHLQMIIITRFDPPFLLRELGLYHKLMEIRMRDLRFKEHEIAELLAIEKDSRFSAVEIKELSSKTEGWILAIKMIIMAKSISEIGTKEESTGILTKDLDRLISHISENFEPNFLRQIQLCALCEQFNAALIDSICAFAFPDSCKSDIFLAKLKDLDFFIIPTESEGSWYRFHHLVGQILTRDLRKNEPNLMIALYIHISKWFSTQGFVDKAIRYAMKAENYALACEAIIKHRASVLDKGQWWVVQRWLYKIPRQIRNTNVDILLTELLVCEETWNIEDFFSILETLKTIGIENSSDENISQYLFHLGYFFTFVKPEPKKAVESLQRSIALCHDDNFMFGSRRDLILACSRQMLGQTEMALRSLEEMREKSEPSSNKYIRATQGKAFVHLLSGNLESVNNEAKKLQFLVRDSDLLLPKAWSLYFQGNVAFQSYHEYEVMRLLKGALSFEDMINLRVYFDTLAGLIIFSSLKGDEKAAESYLSQMNMAATKLKDTKFQNYYHSVQARVNWHQGQGDKELSWAKTDWVKQHPSSYLFLIDVPEMTKLRILVSHSSRVQVEEVISVLNEVEALLESVHNHYQLIDVFLLKAMGFMRLRRKKIAAKWLEKALFIADKKEMARPVLEAALVMPTLFSILEHTTPYRILNSINIDFTAQRSTNGAVVNSLELSMREQEIIRLISRGLRNKEVADQLNISILTVKKHLYNIYRKLDVPNRTTMVNKILNEDIFIL